MMLDPSRPFPPLGRAPPGCLPHRETHTPLVSALYCDQTVFAFPDNLLAPLKVVIVTKLGGIEPLRLTSAAAGDHRIRLRITRAVPLPFDVHATGPLRLNTTTTTTDTMSGSRATGLTLNSWWST